MKDIFKKIETEWGERKLPVLVRRNFPLAVKNDVLAIIGPRRVGKTYLMYQLIQDLKAKKEETLFIDFEDNRLANLTSQDADEMFVAHKELYPSELQYLFFDEIQALPSWSRFVRKLHNQQRYKIIISGSSAKLLGKEIATELRGRYTSVLVLPFSFTEFLRMKKFEYTSGTQWSEHKGTLLRLFQEYLTFGGYPEIIPEETENDKRKKLQSYFQTIFYKDLVERHNITNYTVLERLMNYLLDNTARIFSITQFERILKNSGLAVSKKTISLYLKYLEEAFFVYAVEEFSYSVKKRMMRPKKIYLIDNGMVTFLSSQLSPDKGRLLENCVLLELKRQERDVLFYYGTHECDFIVQEKSKIKQAIQVCHSLEPHNEKRELQGVQKAMEEFGLQEGLVLTYDQEKSLPLGKKRIVVMPVWKWLLEQSNH